MRSETFHQSKGRTVKENNARDRSRSTGAYINPKELSLCKLGKTQRKQCGEPVGRGRPRSTGAYINPKELSLCKLGKTQRKQHAGEDGRPDRSTAVDRGDGTAAVDRGRPVLANNSARKHYEDGSAFGGRASRFVWLWIYLYNEGVKSGE